MSNAPDLKALQEKREEILKAELAAWLHDGGNAQMLSCRQRAWGLMFKTAKATKCQSS